jgi:hypothetical protein
MRGWTVALKSRSAKKALEGAQIHLTRRGVEKERRVVLRGDEWEIRAIEIRLLPRSLRTEGR